MGGNGVTLNALAESGDELKVGEFASATCMSPGKTDEPCGKRREKASAKKNICNNVRGQEGMRV